VLSTRQTPSEPEATDEPLTRENETEPRVVA